MAADDAGATVLSDDEVLTEGPVYNAPPAKTRVKWYRCHVPREELSKLNKRSDVLGFAQTLGFLAVLAVSAGLAIYSAFHWPWYVTALLVFINGHFWHFLINGFHELIHDSVFRTRWLNGFFLRVFSFLGWYNHHHFWASHTEHHKYTLHPPDDLEVVLPQAVNLGNLWKWAFVNWKFPYHRIRGTYHMAIGRLEGRWINMLFPDTDPQRRRQLRHWSEIVLVGHLAIAVAAIVAGVLFHPGWLVVPFVITFPMMFGGWLHYFCNASQHVGLMDNVPDFRLCCRTIYLNPFFQFLYWHMNYHTEHHMYAAVPCYRLGRLHRLIRHEMPHCPNGLWETWKHIADIKRRQDADPSYQFRAELPTPGIRRDETAPPGVAPAISG